MKLDENNRHFFAPVSSVTDSVIVTLVADDHVFGPAALPVTVNKDDGSLHFSNGENAAKNITITLPLTQDEGGTDDHEPVTMTFNCAWLGDGAIRETGKFGYIVADKRGVTNLFVLPDRLGGVVHFEDDAKLERYREV